MDEGRGRVLTEQQRFWLEHIQSCERAGMALKAYAAEHGLDVRALYGFKRTLTRKGVLQPGARSRQLVRARVLGPAPLAAVCRVHLRNGTVFELAGPVDADAWREVLEAAARVP